MSLGGRLVIYSITNGIMDRVCVKVRCVANFILVVCRYPLRVSWTELELACQMSQTSHDRILTFLRHWIEPELFSPTPTLPGQNGGEWGYSSVQY